MLGPLQSARIVALRCESRGRGCTVPIQCIVATRSQRFISDRTVAVHPSLLCALLAVMTTGTHMEVSPFLLQLILYTVSIIHTELELVYSELGDIFSSNVYP